MKAKAKELYLYRVKDGGGLIEVRIFEVPKPVPPSGHAFKYSLVYVEGGRRVLGFDNERGKGDHFHLEEAEFSYDFRGSEALFADFQMELEK
jgi:hypothetical protein